VESFDQTFSKVCAGGGCETLLALRRARNNLGAFLLQSFSFAPTTPKEKRSTDLSEQTVFLHCTNPLAAFFFDHTGAKKKAIKKETPKVVSRSAEREEGYAPSTAPPFEKRTRASA